MGAMTIGEELLENAGTASGRETRASPPKVASCCCG